MEALLILVAADCVLFAGIIALRDPKLLLPAVVLGLPMEVLETETLGALGDTGIEGAIRSLLNPGQAAMVAAVVLAGLRARHRPARLFPNSGILLPVFAIFAVELLGVAWSDSLTPNKSILILPLYVSFLLAAPSLIENRRDLERIVGAFLLAAALLGPIAIAQRMAGVFNWREILIQSDAYSYRSNATFADPNILGRFLAISMALAAGSILVTGPRRQTLYLAVPALAFGAPALIATASRSGWLALLLCGFVVVMTSPIARHRKLLLTLGALALLGALLGMVLAQGGTDAERVRSISQAWNIVGQRSFLIRAGWAMFVDNPLIGVGSGNYQHSLVVTYLHLVPSWARTTLSHTSFISLLAELGLVGVALFGFAGIRVTAVIVRTYFASATAYHRLVTGWLGAALLTVFMHSQSEGRFLEEPYLWVILALVIAVETGSQSAGEASRAGHTATWQQKAPPSASSFGPRASASAAMQGGG